MKSTSLRRSLLVWFVSLAAALVATVTTVLYVGTREALLEGLDAELRARAEGIGVRTEWDGDQIVLEDDEDGTSSMSQIDGFEIRTWPGLDPVVAEGVLLPATDDGRSGAETHEGLRVVDVIVDRPAMDEEDEPAGPPFRVLVRSARSMTTLQGQLDRVWLLALATLLIGMGTVVAFGFVVSRRVIRPLQLLADAARQVESGAAREMPDRGTGDEVDRLAGVIEGAFEALRATSERQRRFTADASHELRTPLAIVQSSAEVALRRPRDETEYRQALSEVLTAARRMQALLEALLVLARLDVGRSIETSDLELHGVACAAVASAPRRAGVRIELVEGPPVRVRGDAQLLGMLIGNLLANAVRHAASHVRVIVVEGEAGSELRVEDDGGGLPPDELPRLFERFFRGRNSAGQPGSGLGLAIVAAIAATHGGTVSAEHLEPGLRIRVGFRREPARSARRTGLTASTLRRRA